MTFLAPLFLLGAAAVVGPLVFHLVRRNTNQRRLFSSLMFLQPSPPRLSRRHRFEHLLLLLLRCLALTLLAIAFARPFFSSPMLANPTGNQSRRVLVLLDVSASMRREGLWPQARNAAERRLRELAPGDEIALFVFDRTVRPLVTFEEWNRAPASERVALALRKIDEVRPGWFATNVGGALTTAAELIGESDRKTMIAQGEIVLISDLQTGSKIDGLQGFDWPKGVTVSLVSVLSAHATNAAVQPIASARDVAARGVSAVRVRVSNVATAKQEQFQLQWVDGPPINAPIGAPIDAYVPPGQSRAFTMPVPSGTKPTRIVLRGDDDPFDNSTFVVPPVQRTVTVRWIGRESIDDPASALYFLRRAYPDNADVAVRLSVQAPDVVPTPSAPAPDLIFVASNVGAAQADAIAAAARSGKTVVIVLRKEVDAATLDRVLGTSATQLAEATVPNYAMFADVDFRHPLFASFADPRFSDFTKIHVWHYRRLELNPAANARVLAKLDTGDPAVVEVNVGTGRVIVFATSWQPDDSQLAVSSKFVPLMWSLLDLAGALPEAGTLWSVGDSIPIPSGAKSVRKPSGTLVPVESGALRYNGADEPGVYEFATPTGTSRVAVNLDPAESRTVPLASEDFEHLGVPMTAKVVPHAPATSVANAKAAEVENRQKLWRWAIVAALLVLLAETMLAAWTARRGTIERKEVTA
jgi:hypothetical protein